MATANLFNLHINSIHDKMQRKQLYEEFLKGSNSDILVVFASDLATTEIIEYEELFNFGLIVFSKLEEGQYQELDNYINKLYEKRNDLFLKNIATIEPYIFKFMPSFYFEMCDKKITNFCDFILKHNEDIELNVLAMSMWNPDNCINALKHIALYNTENIEQVKKGFHALFKKSFISKINPEEYEKLSTNEIIKLLNLLKSPMTQTMTDSQIVVIEKLVTEILQRDDEINDSGYETIFSPNFRLANLFNINLNSSNPNSLHGHPPKIVNIMHKMSKKTVEKLCTHRPAKLCEQRFFHSMIDYCDEKITSFDSSIYGKIIKNFENLGEQSYFNHTREMFPHNLCENVTIIVSHFSKVLEFAFSHKETNDLIRKIILFPKNIKFNTLPVTNVKLITTLNLWELMTVDSAKLVLAESGFRALFTMPDNVIDELLTNSYIESLLSSDDIDSFLIELSNSDVTAQHFKKSFNCVVNVAQKNKDVNIGKCLYQNRKVMDKLFIEKMLNKELLICVQVYDEHVTTFQKIASKYFNIVPCFTDPITVDVATEILFPETQNSDFGVCKICDKNNIEVVFTGCGHSVCTECKQRLKSTVCPFCRNPAPNVKLYM